MPQRRMDGAQMRRQLRRDPKQQERGQQGLTLLELVIAVAVLSLGAIAATRAMDQARLSLGGAMPRLMAQIAAQNRAEELRLLGPVGAGSLPAQVQMGAHSISVQVETEATAAGLFQARITARGASGPGAVLVTFLPPQVPDR